MKDLKIRWHTPDQEEIYFVHELYNEFIKFQITMLDLWFSESKNSQIKISKFQLEKCLSIIYTFSGFRNFLPKFLDNINTYE